MPTAHRIAGRLTRKSSKTMYDVWRLSMGNVKRLVSGPHTWPIAWRTAAKMNDQARKDFREGRTMYDVPEFVVEKRS